MPSATAFTRLEPSAIGGIVADVPYLCDGITAFAILVLLAIKGRLVPFNIIVLLAALFYSLSAFIDLGERIRTSSTSLVVGHGAYGIEDGSVTSAIVRDVLLAMGHFMQFTFFWVLVALPARGELTNGTRMMKMSGQRPLITAHSSTINSRDPLPSPPNGRMSFFPDARDFHSGSWANLGMVGVVAQWLVLGLIVANFGLQLYWRIGSYTDTHTDVSTVELADLITQLVIVSVLMMKLLFNTVFLSTLAVRLQALFAVLAVLIAMGISIGLSITQIAIWKNILQLPLPRLLDALAIWIQLVYILAVAFEDVEAPGYEDNCPHCDLPRLAEGPGKSKRSLLRKPRRQSQVEFGVNSQLSERTMVGSEEPLPENDSQVEVRATRKGLALPRFIGRRFVSRNANDTDSSTSREGPILPLHSSSNPQSQRPRSDDPTQHTFQVHEPWNETETESDVSTVGRRSLVGSESIYSIPDVPLPPSTWPTGSIRSSQGPIRPDSGLRPTSSIEARSPPHRIAFASSPNTSAEKALGHNRTRSGSELRSPLASGRTKARSPNLSLGPSVAAERTPPPGTPPIAPPLLDSSVLLDHFPQPPRKSSSSVSRNYSSGDIPIR